MRKIRLLLALALTIAMPPQHGRATERWETLPVTPPAIGNERTGIARVNGIALFYAEIGQGPPVLLLHGGLANSDYFGHQVRSLSPHHRVILVDSRGHGRSTRDARPFGYDLMTDDVVGLLDMLKIGQVDIVGWSDGAIIGLDMAMRYPARVRRVVAFGANTLTSGVKDNVEQNPTFAAFIARAGREYAHLSPTPGQFAAFQAQISKMWATQPNWTAAQLQTIKSPVLVMDGDHDEAIRREHTEYIAATIPGATLLILPEVSHFAFLQDPATFSAAILRFIGNAGY